MSFTLNSSMETKMTENNKTISGWNITTINYFMPEYMPPKQIDIDQLGWWLYHGNVANIWWKEGYFLYFNINANLTMDHVKKTILLFTEIDNIFYTKGNYERFVKINLECWKTELTGHAKNTTEYVHIPVFNLPNPLVEEIVNEIKANDIALS